MRVCLYFLSLCEYNVLIRLVPPHCYIYKVSSAPHTYIRTYAHTHMHTYIPTYIHTHAHALQAAVCLLISAGALQRQGSISRLPHRHQSHVGGVKALSLFFFLSLSLSLSLSLLLLLPLSSRMMVLSYNSLYGGLFLSFFLPFHLQ